MKRRSFLKQAAVGVAAGAVAAPAIAQSCPAIQWRMAASWPKSLDTIYGGAELVAKRVAEITDGKFQIRAFAAGEIVPALQVLDAVQAGTVEIGHTATYYYFGKDPAFALGSVGPVRPEHAPEQCLVVLRRRRRSDGAAVQGVRLHRDSWPATPAARWAAGSARRSRPSPICKGLKFRIGGMAGLVLAKLGVVPQMIGGPDIYPALEKGTIDGAEWVGPYDDEKLGFNKVAQYYYYPGWWEGGPMLHGARQREEVERAAQVLPGGVASRLRRSQRLDAGEVRRAKPAGPAPAGGERHQAAAVPEGGDGGVREGGLRALRRAHARRARTGSASIRSGRNSATSSSSGSVSPNRPTTTTRSTRSSARRSEAVRSVSRVRSSRRARGEALGLLRFA